MRALRNDVTKWLIEHDILFPLMFYSSIVRLLTFPLRLCQLREFVRLRERQATEFVVGEWVRARKPTEEQERKKVVIGPRAQDFFDECHLGAEVDGGRIWRDISYGPGSAMHSLYQAREPWKITKISLSPLNRDVGFYLRGYTLTHRCILTLENQQIIYGDKVIPWIPADIFEKVSASDVGVLNL